MTEQFHSQITFLYYDHLNDAAAFYENVLDLPLVHEQSLARIYRLTTGAFLGIVDGNLGFHQAQEKNAVVVSLVVDDVLGWYERLSGQGVRMLTEPEEHAAAPVQSFFFQDPGGYSLEMQAFTRPELREMFHGSG